VTDDDVLAQRLARTLAEAGEALPSAPPGTIGRIRHRLARRRRRARATRAAVAALITVGIVVASFGPQLGLRLPGPPPAATNPGIIRIWALVTVERNLGLRACIDSFEQDTGTRVELSTFTNDAYKRLLSGPVPAGDAAPEIFETWGGATLAEQARAGAVADLTDDLTDRPEVAGAILDNVLAGGRVDGRQYGLPMTGVQPVMLFYHKQLFADAGLAPPRTFAELLTAVDTFRTRKVTPIALAGAAGWPALMYLAYLTDRLGGPGVFADIAAGRPGAWQHPALLRAAEMTQQLVRRGAFGADAATLSYDDGAASRQLAEGKAAMQLMGSWEYGNQLGANPAFAAGDLGWVPFPAVPDGTGDPADVVGVPANYFSVDARDPHRAEAVEFVLRTVTSPAYLDGLLDAGEVPAVDDLESRLAGRPNADFVRYTHRLATGAPVFTLMWDQALPWAVATALLTNTRKLFQLALTPAEFTTAMAAAG
jgi:xylobiose transport system substrate-binding protein